MKKIVTLFSCLLFITLGFCTPAYAATTSKLITLNSSIFSITSNTFYSIFIAIVIAFFLLGIIIGYILNPRRKLRKNKEKALIETAKTKPEEPKDLGQDTTRNESDQINGPYASDRRSRYYDNYRYNSNTPRR